MYKRCPANCVVLLKLKQHMTHADVLLSKNSSCDVKWPHAAADGPELYTGLVHQLPCSLRDVLCADAGVRQLLWRHVDFRTLLPELRGHLLHARTARLILPVQVVLLCIGLTIARVTPLSVAAWSLAAAHCFTASRRTLQTGAHRTCSSVLICMLQNLGPHMLRHSNGRRGMSATLL